ncbi:MAG: phage DNA encapsidation protein [Methanobrevibacter sp.]|nr:phage DNA encapsidation protein [Methanobrevibacter sp.]
MGKIKHYNIDTIDKLGATINLIFGERSNGKSYQVKHKKGILPQFEEMTNYHASYLNKNEVIKTCMTTDREFMLVRRWREEISPALVEKYFDDVDIEKISNGQYDMITVYRGEIYLSVWDNDKKRAKRVKKIGYVVALSTEQKYAGSSFLKVTDIIFEEFMSRGLYLPHESAKLMNLYSTVDRKRGIVRLWLVGNTISKVCPYLTEWGILDIVRHMKQGEIKTKWISTGDYDDAGNLIEVKLAIEYCESTGNTSFIIGEHKEMLNKGDWQAERQPKLSKSFNCYDQLFHMFFIYKGFKFICYYLKDKENYSECWFIAPFTKEIGENELIFSDDIKESSFYQTDIYNPLIKSERIKLLLKTFKESNIFYASDMTGTDFKQAINFDIRK